MAKRGLRGCKLRGPEPLVLMTPNSNKNAMHGPAALQLTPDGRLKHLLTTEGLPKSLITELLDTVETFLSSQGQPVKRFHYCAERPSLIYFLRIQRELNNLDIAAHRLSADVVTLDIRTSSASKEKPCLIRWKISKPCRQISSSCAIMAVRRFSSQIA